ncbi:MAG: hypothetical protein V7709_09055 [Halioglobus sp.]
MHELKRRAYLDAMGIATYVSRGPLPGAATTTKLAIARRSMPQLDSGSFPQPLQSLTDTAAARMPSVDFPKQAGAERPEVVVQKIQDRVNVPTVEFGVTAFVTGRWLWLEELPRNEALMRDQVILVQSMARAMGWGSGKPDISTFNWPIHNSSQLEQGEAAARAALGGFISRKLDTLQGRGLVLLGDNARHWVPREQFAASVCIATISTADMLRDSLLKKQAWRDLHPHAESG